MSTKVSKNKNDKSQEEDEYQNSAQIGIHSLKNLLGSPKQLDFFNQESMESLPVPKSSTPLQDPITQLGMDLTDLQLRVMEGILRGFTQTNYKGNMRSRKKEDIHREKFGEDDLPEIYKNVKQIPRLKVTASELISWSGLNSRDMAHRKRVTDSITKLVSTPFCFYYDRLSYNKKGKPEKEKNGEWKMEEVFAIDTLFNMKFVKDKKSGNIKYYEFEPSPIFLDQRENYFVLVPFNWREEVQKLVGSKKTSSYTFKFLLFLRYQFEMMRRRKEKTDNFIIEKTWESIAISLKIPESVYKRKKSQALKILDDAYYVAKRLGYLKEYERIDGIDILTLDQEKYYNPQYLPSKESETKSSNSISPEVEELFTFFHEQKRKIDKNYSSPSGKYKFGQLDVLSSLLKERLMEDIKKVIEWGISKKYWTTRINTPAKLRKSFSEVWTEMLLTCEESRRYVNRHEILGIIQKCTESPYIQFSGSDEHKTLFYHFDALESFGKGQISIYSKSVDFHFKKSEFNFEIYFSESNALEKFQQKFKRLFPKKEK